MDIQENMNSPLEYAVPITMGDLETVAHVFGFRSARELVGSLSNISAGTACQPLDATGS